MFLDALGEEDRQAARTFMQPNLRTKINETVNKLDRLAETATLVLKGKISYERQEYIFGNWVTIADYSRLYNFKPARVQNWIDREIVPRQNVVVIRELNDLKLVKNVPCRS